MREGFLKEMTFQLEPESRLNIRQRAAERLFWADVKRWGGLEQGGAEAISVWPECMWIGGVRKIIRGQVVGLCHWVRGLDLLMLLHSGFSVSILCSTL